MNHEDSRKHHRARQQLDFILDRGCRSLVNTLVMMIDGMYRLVRSKRRYQKREKRVTKD